MTNLLEYLRHMASNCDGKITFLFILLTWSMMFDWLSGTIVAYINKEASSKIGINGILRKILIFLGTITILLCSVVIPESGMFVITTLIALLVMELQSINENFKKANIKETTIFNKLIDMLKGGNK